MWLSLYCIWIIPSIGSCFQMGSLNICPVGLKEAGMVMMIDKQNSEGGTQSSCPMSQIILPRWGPPDPYGSPDSRKKWDVATQLTPMHVYSECEV